MPVSSMAQPFKERPVVVSASRLDLTSAQIMSSLLQRYGDLRSNVCHDTEAPTKKGPPHECDDGDMVLFNGILCLYEIHKESCSFVKNSQDHSGRVWRAPYRRGLDNKNEFSRDMAIGFLAYVLKTADLTSLYKWAEWVKKHDGLLCLGADDFRCHSGRGIRSIASQVASFHGGSLDWGALGTWNTFGSDFQLYLHTLFAEEGYPVHLIAVQLMIKRAMGREGDLLDVVAYKLHKRDPLNPIYALLANRPEEALQGASLAVTKLIQHERSPGVEHPLGYAGPENHIWTWENHSRLPSARHSMGWDFLLLSKLIQLYVSKGNIAAHIK
jgi:hypothetical protein